MPFAAWPKTAECRAAAHRKAGRMHVDELGVGVRVPAKDDARSDRSEQVARVSSKLMTGETAPRARGHEENGCIGGQGAGSRGQGRVMVESWERAY